MLRDCHTHNLNSTDGIISINPGFTYFLPDKHYSCGIHPWIEEQSPDIIDSLITTLNNPQIIAVGEAGLDRLKGLSLEIQTKIFLKQIELSEQLSLPIIIHSVRTSSELLHLKKTINPSQPWIFHGFRGGYLQAKQLSDAGFYISIGEKFNYDAIKAIPDNLLLLETDESKLTIQEIASRVKPDALKISTYNLNNLLNK